MIKKIIYRILERRHYWRYIDFGELAELYATRMLRLLAVSMVAGMVAIYLYQMGYGLTFIMWYFAGYFLLRAFLEFPAARLVSRIGPKHGMLIGNVLYVPALALMTIVPKYGLWALVLSGSLQATSVTIYALSHLVDFSKVKHSDHAGKEIGYMNIVDRVATSLSPLIGGIVAYIFGPSATMWLAAGLFAIAAVPLFFTPEPTHTHQKIMLRGFNWRYALPGMIAGTFAGADLAVSSGLWSLFIAVTIFGVSSNSVYAQVGALATVTVIASLVFSRLFGKIIDNKQGETLLRLAVMGNSILHLFRPFVSTTSGVALVNVVNESVTIGYSMPFLRGTFDIADNLPGYRIVYLAYMELAAIIGNIFMFGVVGAIGLFLDAPEAMQLGFVLCGMITLAISFNRFPALRGRD